MRNNLKKFICSFLVVVLMVCTMPFSAFAATKAPSKPATPTATSTVSSVTVKWKKTTDAKGYELYRYNTSTKKSTKLVTTTKLSYTNSKLASGKVYAYYVKAYNLTKAKKKVYSKPSSKVYIATKPSKPTSFKVASKTYSSVKVSWAKCTGATSYKVQCSTSSTFTSPKTYTVTTNYKNFTSLKEKTKYYFRVYAIKTYNKKNYTSASSSVISTTTSAKPLPPSPYPDDNTNVTKSTIDVATTYQTIDGFGASAAWWSKKVGTWSDEDATRVMKLLYSKDEGIGLNIYRYNLGAGSSKNAWTDLNATNVGANGKGDASMSTGSSAESFVKSYDEETKTFEYDFENNDVAAQRCLSIAKDFCPDLRLTLFSNSPPVEITSSHRGVGNWELVENGTDKPWEIARQNIEYDNYNAFADYVIACGNHFADEGYRVTDISPVNEPQFAWCTIESYINDNGDVTPGWGGQEGCHYSTDDNSKNNLRRLYYAMIQKIQKNTGYDYKISMFESGAAEGKDTVFSNYLEHILSSNICKDYFDDVSVHAYWSSAETKKACAKYLDELATQNGKRLSVKSTEYCQMYEDANTGIKDYCDEVGPTNAEGINAGVAMAKIIYDDMSILNATEWDWWTACSNGIYPDGLVYINNDNHSSLMLSKRFYCLGNYSKFISEGAKRVKISETNSAIKSTAFLNPDGSKVVVYVNDSTKSYTATVGAKGVCEAYTTSATKDLEKTDLGTASTSVKVSVPSQSVVTLVIK